MNLHIVNGSTVSQGLAAAGIAGATVEYADVLHEGPVPRERDPDAFDDVRARFLAGCGWASVDEARAHISRWRALLASPADFDGFVLWYEHDLFDQLLLLRLLNWWRIHPGVARPFLVSPADYLGLQTDAGLRRLFDTRQPVSDAQLELAAVAWQAVTDPGPEPLVRLVRNDDGTTLPHLAGALLRLLEEYPAAVNGLGRTERQILEILDQSPLPAFDLFTANARREERVFMGDATFFLHTERLLDARRPLIACDEQGGPIEITDNGKRVLHGELDNIALNGINKCIGGVHLTSENIWRWNGETMIRA